MSSLLQVESQISKSYFVLQVHAVCLIEQWAQLSGLNRGYNARIGMFSLNS